MVEASSFSSAVSPATLTIACPPLYENASPLTGSRHQAPGPFSSMHELTDAQEFTVRSELAHVHELAHFQELYSSDMGLALTALEILEASRMDFLLERLKMEGLSTSSSRTARALRARLRTA